MSTAINDFNVAVVGQSGKVGTVRYVQKGGKTYVRSASNRTTAKSNPRSDAQMYQRLRYNSLLAIWRLIGGNLAGAFQNKGANVSDMNAFIQANQGLGAYMTKQEYKQGLVIPVAVTIGEGELAGISLTAGTTGFVSNLSLGDATDISTIAKLSEAIVANNDSFEMGDQITFVMGYAESISKKSVRYVKIILSDTDETSTSGISIVDKKLCFTADMKYDFAGALHTDSEGKSSDTLCVLDTDATAIYTQRTTAEAFQTARDSYGKARNSYLRPSANA